MPLARYCNMIAVSERYALNQQAFNRGASPLGETPISYGIIILCAVIYFMFNARNVIPLGFAGAVYLGWRYRRVAPATRSRLPATTACEPSGEGA